MQNKEFSQNYYKRKLIANKLKRLISGERKRIKFYLWLLKFAMILITCILGIFILKLPQWHINQTYLREAKPWVLKIEGNIVTPEYKIIDMIRQTELKDVGIYRLDIKELQKNITELETVKKVYIRRFWLPSRLYIKLEERIPVFTIAPNLETPPISAITLDGVFIGRDYMPISPRFKTVKILSYGVKDDDYEKWDKAKVENLLDLISAIQEFSGQDVIYIDMRDSNDTYIQLTDYLIRFGKINDTAIERAKSLHAIIPEVRNISNNKTVEYIDIRFENSKYIKTKK